MGWLRASEQTRGNECELSHPSDTKGRMRWTFLTCVDEIPDNNALCSVTQAFSAKEGGSCLGGALVIHKGTNH